MNHLQKQELQSRLIILMSVIDYEQTTLIGSLSGHSKGLFNTMTNHLKRLKNEFLKEATPENKLYFDDIGALFWELLHEFEKADNKATILALCRAYNAGQVTINNEPLKQTA